MLLAHTLGVRRIDLYLQHERILGERELAPYRELTARRGKGEPVAYLMGHREFMALDFEVTPAVLVPNPDTELLVQRAIAWARERESPPLIADVGTGSGCIAVAIARYAPAARIIACDVDAAALEVAKRNAVRHGVEGRVELVQSDLLQNLPSGLDLACANLPYIADGEQLPPEVIVQPPRALFAGPKGTELNERFLAEAPHHLAPGGAVMIEFDPRTVTVLAPIAERHYAGHRLHRDAAGRERVLEAWSS